MTNESTYRARTLILDAANDTTAWEDSPTTYRCEVHLHPEEAGGLSAVAAKLLGVASQGRTEAEALANITEAIEAAIEAYSETGSPIPWMASPRQPADGSLVRWVFPRV